MLLVDWEIKNLCDAGLVTPFDEELINPSSVDVRIGYTALQDTETGFRDYPQFKKHTKDYPYRLMPNECLLVATLENFKLPSNIACELKLKSSRAREGLSHALAGWIDNGFNGVLTLELKNYSQYREIPIYPGLRIGQLIVFDTSQPTKTYEKGRYSGHTTVIPSLDDTEKSSEAGATTEDL